MASIRRFEAPIVRSTFTPRITKRYQAGGPGDPRREMYDPDAMGYGIGDPYAARERLAELERKMLSFGPEGPPPDFDPKAFKASSMVPEKSAPYTFGGTTTPEPKEKYPYLPGEDYWAFTRRMDKVFKRGPLDVPKRGDPDFMPTMIDMYAKLPGSSKSSTSGLTTTKRKIY